MDQKTTDIKQKTGIKDQKSNYSSCALANHIYVLIYNTVNYMFGHNFAFGCDSFISLARLDQKRKFYASL